MTRNTDIFEVTEKVRQMQDYGINMSSIRKQLQVSSIRTKVEVAHLVRIGKILMRA